MHWCSDSKAFLGDRFAAGSKIRLASVDGEQAANPSEVTIVFDQPVQPGSKVTVALAAQQNPGGGGIYEFGVTAYPAGENGLGQFLGYGRINFYGNSDWANFNGLISGMNWDKLIYFWNQQYRES